MYACAFLACGCHYGTYVKNPAGLPHPTTEPSILGIGACLLQNTYISYVHITR